MKKSILTFLVAGLFGALSFGSVAQAADFEWYGSIRAGAEMKDDDKMADNTGEGWDLGATRSSRIGIKGSTDLGNGSSAGLTVERSVAGFVRRENAWIGGDWGTLRFGIQSNPYRKAAGWAQEWFYGGAQIGEQDSGGAFLNGVFDDGVDATAISYTSNLDGPFNFAVLVTGGTNENASADRLSFAIDGTTESAGPNANDAVNVTEFNSEAPAEDLSNDIDMIKAAAFIDLGNYVTLNLGYSGNQLDLEATRNTETDVTVTGGNAIAGFSQLAGNSFNHTVIGANGSVGILDWYVGYETSTNNAIEGDDSTTLGFFGSLDLSEADKIYLEYEASDYDFGWVFDDDGNGRTNLDGSDATNTVLGYSHGFGAATFIAEYATQDMRGDADDGDSPSQLSLVIKVDF